MLNLISTLLYPNPKCSVTHYRLLTEWMNGWGSINVYLCLADQNGETWLCRGKDMRCLKFWSPSVSRVQRLTKAVRLKDCRINWDICLWCILLSTKHLYGQQSLRSQSCSVSRLEESTTNNPPLALFFSSHYGAFGCCRGDSHSSVFNMLKEKYSNYSWFTTSCWFSHILIPSGPNSSWKKMCI